MKILYSIWDKGQRALSRKECEGPRGFLPPWGQQSQVLQKKGLEEWPRPKLPAPWGSGETQAPLPQEGQRRQGWGQAPIPTQGSF